MRKNFNRVVALVAALAFAGAAFVGCSSASNQETTTKATDAEGTTAAQGSEEQNTTQTEAPAAKEVVKVITGGGPIPYVSVNDDGELEGYDVAVLVEVFNRLPQYEVEFTVAGDHLAATQSGLYDIALGNIAYRPERAEVLYYSFPYKLTDKVFIQRPDDEPLTSLDDAAARGYKIEVGAAGPVTFAVENYNAEHPDQQIEVIYTDADFLVRFQHVSDGIADFAMDDSPIVNKYVQDFGLDLKTYELTSEDMQAILPSVYTYYLFTKDERGAAIRADVDAVLKELYEDGTLAKLSLEYFGSDVTPAADAFEEELN